jgi:hypothetical protein
LIEEVQARQGYDRWVAWLLLSLTKYAQVLFVVFVPLLWLFDDGVVGCGWEKTAKRAHDKLTTGTDKIEYPIRLVYLLL